MEGVWTMLQPWLGHWMTQVFAVVLLVVLVNALLVRVLNRIHRRVHASETLWDDALFAAVVPPVRVFTWVQGIAIAAGLVDPLPQDQVFALVAPTRKLAMIAILVWFLLRLIQQMSIGVVHRARSTDPGYDDTTVEAVSKLLRLAVFITGALVMLQTMGVSVSGVLAFGGIGGLAIGFAAKDMLANLFGGLTVYLDRPFAKGDWIRSPEQDIEGVVEEIGWRTTRIRRFDKRPIMVPNSLFTSLVIENPSRMTHRRIRETIGIRYCDAQQMQPITDAVRDYLNNHADIDQQQIILVHFDSFGASSLDFFIYCLTRTRDWAEYHRVKHAVLLKVLAIVEEHGAEVAFPTRTLEIVRQAAPEAV